MHFEDLQLNLARHLRDPETVSAPLDLEDRRLQIYRELLFNNVSGLLAGNFPVIRRLLSSAEWQQLVRHFYIEHTAHTPLFHELGSEFVQFLGEHPQHWQTQRPFLHELAHYEWIELALDLSDADIDAEQVDPHCGDLIESIPVPSPVAWLLGYQYPVHLIRPDFQPQAPSALPNWLLIYRNRADRVQFQALEPLAGRLLALAQEDKGLSGRDLVMQLASEITHPNSAELLVPARALLQGWLERDVILGTRAALI